MKKKVNKIKKELKCEGRQGVLWQVVDEEGEGIMRRYKKKRGKVT